MRHLTNSAESERTVANTGAGVNAANFANEFNDVLASITGFAELAAANPHVRGDAKLALYIDEIRKSGLRGSALLRHWMNRVHADDSAAANGMPALPPR